MDLIKQRHKNDCTIASVAMVTGVSYAEARVFGDRIGFEPDGPHGLRPSDLLIAMGYDFFTAGLSNLFQYSPCLVSVRSVNIPNGLHLIAMDGDNVFDPSTGDVVDRDYVEHNSEMIYVLLGPGPAARY